MFTVTIEDQNGQVADTFSFDHGSYTIGRLDDCDVVLPSNSVSRQHARIFIEDGHCYVEDLGSANGVIVDGQRVVQKRNLGTASQIRVGDFYLYLEYQRPSDSNRQDVMSTLFIDSGTEHHKLVRINDSFAGEEFSLSEQENTIGRTDDNFILLSDTSISRRHAVIHRRGDVYLAEDRGSSNGTRVNDRDINQPVELAPGDRVEFGNLEFLFVEGDTNINPAEISSSSSSSLSTYAGIAGLLVVGLLMGAAVVFGVIYITSDEGQEEAVVDEAVDPVEAEVQHLLENGENQLGSGNWSAAQDSFEEALALAPEHAEAQRMLQRVSKEREADEKLTRAQELSSEGRHSEARELLVDLPEDTIAHRRAQSTLSHLNNTISHNLQSQIRRLLRRDDEDSLVDAHDKASQIIAVDSDAEGLNDLIDQIEGRLDEADVDYEPLQRP